jgi:hypothetical protein
MEVDFRMQMDYEFARRLEGSMIQFKNKHGEWAVGKVVKVKKDGLEIEELNPNQSREGYGFGFFSPFFGPPVFFPFVGFAFVPFLFW